MLLLPPFEADWPALLEPPSSDLVWSPLRAAEQPTSTVSKAAIAKFSFECHAIQVPTSVLAA
ncbi:MAG: hypothetical protein ACOY0T_00195 [Myxococcota bacterium]